MTQQRDPRLRPRCPWCNAATRSPRPDRLLGALEARRQQTPRLSIYEDPGPTVIRPSPYKRHGTKPPIDGAASGPDGHGHQRGASRTRSRDNIRSCRTSREVLAGKALAALGHIPSGRGRRGKGRLAEPWEPAARRTASGGQTEPHEVTLRGSSGYQARHPCRLIRRDGDPRSALRRPRRQLTEFGSRAHLGQPLPFVRLPTVAAQSWPQTPHRHHAFQPDPAPSAVGSIPPFRVG